MDDLTYDILRTAVTLAKNEQIRSLKTLRVRLDQCYPQAPDQCSAAISAWAKYVQNAHPNGVSRV